MDVKICLTDAGTRPGQHAEDGEEQFQFDPMFAVLNKYLLDDDLVLICIGNDGRAAGVKRFLILWEKRPIELGDQILALLSKLFVLPDVQHFPGA